MIGVLASLSTCSGADAITIGVIPGQKSVDPSTLPFACLTIVTDGYAMPLEKIVLEDLSTHKEVTTRLGKSFGRSHPNYLTGIDKQDRWISMPILALRGGVYRLVAIEFSPSDVNGPDTCLLSFRKRSYRFRIKDGYVNYVGSLVIKVDWAAVRRQLQRNVKHAIYNGDTNAESVTSEVDYKIENTQDRDAAWATKIIPEMAKLPSWASGFEFDSK